MIKINDLSVIYNKGKENECVALHDVNLTVNDGEMLAVMGKSGAGKTTLLLTIAGLIKDYRGSCMVEETDIGTLNEKQLCRFRQQKIGLIFQDDYLLEECSVRDNLLLALNSKKMKRIEREQAVAQALKKVNFAKKYDCVVGNLSGGEKKRVAIARALMNEHNLILADEPTGNLDTENSRIIMELLKQINDKGTTVIIITHDKDVAAYCDRTIIINDGVIVDNCY